MLIERSFNQLAIEDLNELYGGSMKRLSEYFIDGQGQKWNELYDIENPVAVALCQGAAMHFHDGCNGIKDFDVWFFYPYNEKHLPNRTIWNWDYQNDKFGSDPQDHSYKGRRVDVMVRSIKNYDLNDPKKTISDYLAFENTISSNELAKKAAVLISPPEHCGRVVWYKEKI